MVAASGRRGRQMAALTASTQGWSAATADATLLPFRPARFDATVAAWRLGMAHLSPFVARLPPQTRQRLIAATIDAVGPRPPPVRPRVLILTARVP